MSGRVFFVERSSAHYGGMCADIPGHAAQPSFACMCSLHWYQGTDGNTAPSWPHACEHLPWLAARRSLHMTCCMKHVVERGGRLGNAVPLRARAACGVQHFVAKWIPQARRIFEDLCLCNPFSMKVGRPSCRPQRAPHSCTRRLPAAPNNVLRIWTMVELRRVACYSGVCMCAIVGAPHQW